MSVELTVKLPDKVYKRIERYAELIGRDVDEALAFTLGDTLPPLSSEMDTRPIQSLSDKDVLAVADSMMDETLNGRMNELLQKQQAAPLNEAEEATLQMVMDIYSSGQLRKAEGWVEVIRRGLRERPNP